MGRYLVTGGAGYIGSHIVDRLLLNGHQVVALDNLSTGQSKFMENASRYSNFTFVCRDILHFAEIVDEFRDIDAVFHFAANADVKNGWKQPQKDLEENIIGTSNVLEAMRENGCKNIIFASTSAVYGDPIEHPTSENTVFPKQTSFYGASKMAAEGFVSSYCEGYDFTGTAFRFVTVLGQRYPHGFVYDWVKRLRDNPKELKIFGDGTAIKSSLNIRDCVDAIMLLGLHRETTGYEVYNIGTEETYTVKEAAHWVCDELKINPNLNFGNTKRGWPGDSVHLHLDISKAKVAGWTPKYGVEATVRETARWVNSNTWLFDLRT